MYTVINIYSCIKDISDKKEATQLESPLAPLSRTSDVMMAIFIQLVKLFTE